MKELLQAAHKAYDSIQIGVGEGKRFDPSIFGVTRELYVQDWISHVSGEASGLERSFPAWVGVK